jgi:hypothetical protein
MPPPIPPTIDSWASLPDEDKEAEWGLFIAWLDEHDAVDFVLSGLCDSDWHVIGVKYINTSPGFNLCPYGKDPSLS